MQLQWIHPGDVVEVDVRGFCFMARVKSTNHGALRIQPIDNRVTYFRASARQVVGIWHANKDTRRRLEREERQLAIGVEDDES